ncbi:hypothetical protein [Streptomyces sp. NPDC020917]|uniref:hypothetical protein n=1 Tax=Streptomyces sp. NPDC020917 TaxID=3365102 RepID=UPI0037A52EA7
MTGWTVVERRMAAIGGEEAQWVRALVRGEPRGRSGMYGAAAWYGGGKSHLRDGPTEPVVAVAVYRQLA